MNAYFFSHHTPPRPSAVPVPVGRRAGAGSHGAAPNLAGASATAAAAATSRPTSARGDAVPRDGLDADTRRSRPPSAAGVRQRPGSGGSRGWGNADVAHRPPEPRSPSMEAPRPARPGAPPTAAAFAAPAAATTTTPPPPHSVPCLVLFSPQGPRPLEGLTTTTLSHPSRSSSGGTAGVDEARRRAALHTRTNVMAAGGGATAEHRGDKQVALRGAASSAARGRGAAPDGVRCVFDRDTRSQLLHIAPGTEVDFSACMRLPALATTSSAMTTMAGVMPVAAVHTVVAVQFCVAAPAPSARHPIDAAAAASPVPPPGSFHIELVLRAAGSASSAATAGTPTRGRGSSTASHVGGYRLRFTNAVHEVQRHAHHTKVPLQCVRVAQWVNLFVDLEALLLASQAATGSDTRRTGAATAASAAPGAGTGCRLHQLRIASSGSATSTGGLYIRRVVAGHGLPLPHPAVDHLVATGFAPGTTAHASATFASTAASAHESAVVRRGGGWVPPEALRLPPEAGESLCVFVRTGEEYVLGARPALPTPDTAVAAAAPGAMMGSDGSDGGRALPADTARDAERGDDGDVRRRPPAQASSPPPRPSKRADLSTPPRVGEGRRRSATLPPPPSPPPSQQHQVQDRSWAQERRSPSPATPREPNVSRRADAAVTAAAPAPAPSLPGAQPDRDASRPRSRGAHPTALEMLRQREPGAERADVARGVGAAAAAGTPALAAYDRVAAAADPSTHSLAFSALSPSSPVDVSSSLATSEEAEHFVVRQIADAADLRVSAAAMRQQQQRPSHSPYKSDDLAADTRRAALYEVVPPPARAEVCEVEEVREVALARGRGHAAAAPQSAQRRPAKSRNATAAAARGADADETGEDASASLVTLDTTDDASCASDLSVPSYATAVALMEEMQERLYSIHAVLEEVSAASAAAPLPSPARAAPSLPPSRVLSPPPTLSRPPLAPSPSPPPPLLPQRPGDESADAKAGAPAGAAGPLLPPPPPLVPAAAETQPPPPSPPPPPVAASSAQTSSAPPSRPTTAADLMEAVLQGMTRTAGAGTSSATPRTTPVTVPAAAPPPVSAGVGPFTPPDPTSILELWNSTEALLQLPHLSEVLTPPRPPPVLHSALAGAGQGGPRVPLAARLRAHQAALSSTSSSSNGDGTDATAGRDSQGGPTGPAMTPPTSARTSWTFHSAPLTAQSPSSTTATNATVTARRLLPISSANDDNHNELPVSHAVKPLAQPPRSRVPLVTAVDPAADAAAAVMSSNNNVEGAHLTRAVVWRRPTTAVGLQQQQQQRPTSRRLGEATRRALQDEVRFADTPPSRLSGPAAAITAAAGGEEKDGDGQRQASDRIVVWSARQDHTPRSGASAGLQTPRGVVRSAAAAEGAAQARLLDGPQPQPQPQPQQRGVLSAGAHSLSTVSSFHMWLPSPGSAAALPVGAGRYPSTTTPSSGGRGGLGPASDSSSAAAAAASAAGLEAIPRAATRAGEGAAQRPPAPRLGPTTAPTTRPPLPPSTSSAAPVPPTASSREAYDSRAVSGEAAHRFALTEHHFPSAAPLAMKPGQPPSSPPSDAADAAAAAGRLPGDSRTAAAAPPEGPRYMYDSVLQCYLDLNENAYVERQGA